MKSPNFLDIYKKFTEKIILILSFLRRNLSKIYLNKYEDWDKLQPQLYPIYSSLLNLYDINEVRNIHTENSLKKSPLAFVEEMKYTLIVDCLGLFGVYPQQEANTLNTLCTKDELITRDMQPSKLAETLKQFVHDNMCFVDISYDVIFCVMAKLEKSLKQSKGGMLNIQVSQQLEVEQDWRLVDCYEFNLLKWMYQLIQSVSSDFKSLLQVCVDLMNAELELSNAIMPFLVHIYLQHCATSDVRRIADEVNAILEKGKVYHRIMFINCLKTLEQWKKEDRAAQINYLHKLEQENALSNNKKKQRSTSNAGGSEFDPRKEKFIQNFDLLKSLLNNDELIKTQYQIGEYKESMMSIDKILSGRSPEEDHDKTYINYLNMYYRANAKINEDFKYIRFEDILKSLKIKEAAEIAKEEEYTGDILEILRYTENAEQWLIQLNYNVFIEHFFFNGIEKHSSESCMNCDDDRIFKVYILSLLSLGSKAVQQFLLNNLKDAAVYFEQMGQDIEERKALHHHLT